MNISSESISRIKSLAKRFTDNTPILCKNHMPDGLPIDKPPNTDSIKSHPYNKFNNIVTDEVNKQLNNYNTCVTLEFKVAKKLRDIFREEYYEKSDFRACIQCYNERLNSDTHISIKMDVPKKYDNIDAL